MGSTQGKTGIGKVIQKTKAVVKNVKGALKTGLNKISTAAKSETSTKNNAKDTVVKKVKAVSKRANVGQRDFTVSDNSSTNDGEINNANSTSHSASQTEIYDNGSLTRAGNRLIGVSDSLSDVKKRFVASQLGVDVDDLDNLQEYFANNGKLLTQVTKELGVGTMKELGVNVRVDSNKNVHLVEDDAVIDSDRNVHLPDSDIGTVSGFVKILDFFIKECENGMMKIRYSQTNNNSRLDGNNPLPDGLFNGKSGFDCGTYLNAALVLSGNQAINFRQLQDKFLDNDKASKYFCKIDDLAASGNLLYLINVGDILYTTSREQDGKKIPGHVGAVTSVDRETGIITYSDMGTDDGPGYHYINVNDSFKDAGKIYLCDENGNIGDHDRQTNFQYLFRYSACPEEDLENMNLLRTDKQTPKSKSSIN